MNTNNINNPEKIIDQQKMPFKNTENMNQIPGESQYKNYIADGLSARRIVYRSVLLINDINEERILTERAPIAVDDGNNVFFRDLIIYLREQNLLDQGSSLFFYDIERQVFVHQGKEPVATSTMIPLKKFSNEEIIIKYRPPMLDMRNMNRSTIYAANNYLQREQLFSNKSNQNFQFQSQQQFRIAGQPEPYPTQMFEEDDDQVNSEVKAVPREKRVKERKIGYVYDRVQEWRRFYETGVPSESGKLQKVNLDVAASLVGLSRKTLDDYFKYIRKAEQFNFDFKARSEEKIGVLRNFVRDRQKRTKNMGIYEDDEEEVIGLETAPTQEDNNQMNQNIDNCNNRYQNHCYADNNNNNYGGYEGKQDQYCEDQNQLDMGDIQQFQFCNAPGAYMDMELQEQTQSVQELDAFSLKLLRQRSELGAANSSDSQYQQEYSNQLCFSNANEIEQGQQIDYFQQDNITSMGAHPLYLQSQYSTSIPAEEYDFISNDYDQQYNFQNVDRED